MHAFTRPAATSWKKARPAAATPSRRSPGSTIRPASPRKRFSPPARARITAPAAKRAPASRMPRRAAAPPKPTSPLPRRPAVRQPPKPPAAPVNCKASVMTDTIYNVLFLCTGNSARSIIAEAILNRSGQGTFRAYSAGSQPKGQVNPHTITLLRGLGYDTTAFRSKSWSEFAQPGAPALDFVFTVCDNAAGEACPVWPGQPMTAHWGVEDPASVEGTDLQKEAAFVADFRFMKNRISAFTNLPLASIDKMSLGTKLREIGRSDGATTLSSDVA